MLVGIRMREEKDWRKSKMKVIEAGYKILTEISKGGIKELQHIEKIGRVCYKSEDVILQDGSSAKVFVAGLIKRQHEAMLEHSSLSVKFTVDRGVSHELVRHRIMSFAQESTRYCNYSKGKFGSEIVVIQPLDMTSDEYEIWRMAMINAENCYMQLIERGLPAQMARSVLPNSLKTEITLTGNYREWRHFFRLRACDATGPAHPQMKEVTIPLLRELKEKLPIIFDDLEIE